MSKHSGPLPVVEWTPSGVTVVLPGSPELHLFSSLAESATLVGHHEVILAIGRRACFVRTAILPNAAYKDVVRALNVSLGQHLPLDAASACFGVRLHETVIAEGRRATFVAMKAADLRSILSEASSAAIRIKTVVPAVSGGWEVGRTMGEGSLAVVSGGVDGLAIDVISNGELLVTRSLAPTISPHHVEQEVCRSFSAAGVPCGPCLAAGVELEFADRYLPTNPLEALGKGAWIDFGIQFELPETALERERKASVTQAWMAAGACTLALLAASWVGVARLDAAADVSRSEARNAATIRKMRSARDAAKSEAAKLASSDALLNRAFQPAQRLGDVVVIVANAAPQGAWLNGISLERGKPLQIRGAALSNDVVSKFLDKLTQEPRFRDVRLVFANNAEIESTPVVQFAITAFPVGNLPLDPNDKEDRK